MDFTNPVFRHREPGEACVSRSGRGVYEAFRHGAEVPSGTGTNPRGGSPPNSFTIR
jgi:hypothetical protein